MGTLKLKALIFLILNCLISNAQHEIYGQKEVTEYSITSYSIAVSSFDEVEWRISPASSGLIIQGQSAPVIDIQWNDLTSSKDSGFCHVMAFVKVPNSEVTLNYLKKIRILEKKEDYLRSQQVNGRLSRQSKDGGRFYYSVICESSITKRSFQFIDSSLFSEKPLEVIWGIKNTADKKIITGKGRRMNVPLSPGKYEITLTHQFFTSSKSLMDTLNVFSAPTPSFVLSNQTPCIGSPMTFSNTSRGVEVTSECLFHFGDGAIFKLPPPQKVVYHSYSGNVSQGLVLLPYLELKDIYGCRFNSNERAISPQQNKFSFTNVTVKPALYTLKQVGDEIQLVCTMGGNNTPANPNAPYTYLWNNGQQEQVIKVNSSGYFSLVVTDKFGCKSPVLRAIVTEPFNKSLKPRIKGPTSITAGTKMRFEMDEKKECLYQWKFIYNGKEPTTTIPTNENFIIPEGWEKSKPGCLEVIGILLQKKDGKQVIQYSDTLRVTIY